MLEWFSAGIASANAAKDITKSLLTLREEEAIRSRVFDLTSALMELQQQLMTAQLEQMTLVKRVGELEAELASQQQQANLRERYELHRLPKGVFAYRLKEQHQAGEPEHYLCSNCFEQNQRVTMHPTRGRGWQGLKCPRCGQTIAL